MERKIKSPLRSHAVSAGKRFISLLLIGAFIVTFGNPLLTIVAQAAVITRQYGDVNWDGEVDSRDTMLILQHNASATISKIHDQHPDWILNGDDYKVADVNNDGTVDSRDVLRVQEYIAAHEQAQIRAKHPEWYTYLQRNYSYNATLTPSSTKYYLDLNGTKSCQIRLARYYGRGCYLKFVPLGSTRDSLGLKLNGWDKAGNNYYFTVTGKVTGNFSFYVNLFDQKKNKLIVSSNVITVNVKKSNSPIPINKKITVYKQTDSRWKDVRYGYSDKAKKVKAYLGKGAGGPGSGCGVLALTNAVYYLNGSFIEPKIIAKYSVDNGYRVNGVGTAFGLYKSFANNRGSKYGFKYIENTSKWDTLKSHLKKGRVAICSKPGHIMAIVNYNQKTGKYLLLDSYPRSSRGTAKNGYVWATKSYLEKTVGLRSSFYVLGSTK